MEKFDDQPAEHEGDKYLQLLGLEHLSDREIATSDGTTLQARDFLEICGEHARPALIGFENMDPNNPNYEPARDILRGMIGEYIKKDK